jgi:glycosyltransferase involved in cell wall biosynthesis
MGEYVLSDTAAMIETHAPRLALPLRLAEHAWPDGTIPVLSICCAAYNHEAFIRECLDGFLMQETTFPVEILIHDDASTDKTAEVIREYEARHPQVVFAVYEKENQYSKGTGDLFSLRRARGQYIAVCEGDDFWTDPMKLQMQVDFLDRNPDYVVCYHDAKIVDRSGNVVAGSKLPTDCRRDFSSEELMKGAWILNLSRVFRRVPVLTEKEAPVRKRIALNGDMLFTARLGKHGKGKYLGDIRPAAYRLHSGSVWSSLDKDSQNVENFTSFVHIYLYHLNYTGRDFAVKFLFESVYPMFQRLFPERNPACVQLREKELFAQNLRNSYTYRAGAVVLWPFKAVRGLWRALRVKAGAP